MPAPDVLWSPPPDAWETTAIGRFAAQNGRASGDYGALWRWSVSDLDGFWAAVWDFFGVSAEQPYERIVSSHTMPGARWFEGARLSYAAHALDAERHRDGVAIVAVSQTRDRVELTWDELREHVARARAGLVRLGVGAGDRVAAYLPNIPETVVAFLAAASLGAIFSTCAPEFGVQAVLDRFGQIEPSVLLVVDGYRYGGRDIDRRDEVARIRAGLPSVRTTVVVPYLHDAPATAGSDTIGWSELVADGHDLAFAAVAPDHPLYVLYSSGTTGLPKPIVHGHGGILLEHLKVLGLHADLGAADRFTWFTTTGWMMWNYLVSGLLVGATIVLFDGDPMHPGPDALWRLCADEQITFFGASAPYLMTCRKAGLRPGTEFDLGALRALGSTGAPLPAEGFRWVYDAVSPDGRVLLSSMSGGTDVCSGFVGACPVVPVWAGEISCRYLGAAVEAFDEDGCSVVDQQGELVITAPMPSMPVGFWDDADGARYRDAYFDTYPGVWRHGDWITITERGSCIITGRSDATLNRGGVRLGTSEIYRVVESIDRVGDSLIVHLEDGDGGPGRLVLFVAPGAGGSIDDATTAAIRAALRGELSPRHVPDEIHAVAAIPTTLSGKKLEVPVKRILNGAEPDRVASRGALRDPTALDEVVAIAARRSAR
jgi:acetoacetyl-CoA synthetase